MKKLTTFAFCFELLLASLAFGALFMSPLAFTVKLFLGSVVILFAGVLELQGLERSLMAERGVELNEIGFRFLEGKIDQSEGGTLQKAYENFLAGQVVVNIMRNEGGTYVLLICAKLALWLGGGALMAIYLLPELLKKYV